MRTGIHLKIAVAAALTATTTALAPTAVATTDAHGRPVPAWHTAEAGRLPDAFLFGVSSVGANNAWAAGLQRVHGVSQGVILHWNGSRWQRQQTDTVPETGVWHALDAASARDVWAYGWSETRETLAHYDGRRWTDTPLPQLSPEQIYGFAKVAAVPGRMWLVSDTRISSYADGQWQQTLLPPGGGVSAIDARTADDAWALGGFAAPGDQSPTVAMHWDGHTWTEVPTVSPTGESLAVSSVYAESARSIWATAVTVGGEDTPQQTRVLHWDGPELARRDRTGHRTGRHGDHRRRGHGLGLRRPRRL